LSSHRDEPSCGSPAAGICGDRLPAPPSSSALSVRHRRRAVVLAVVLASGAILLGASWWQRRVPGRPLGPSDADAVAAAALPAGAVAATVTAATEVTAPFAIQGSASSPGGRAAVLAEGLGDKDRLLGRLRLPVDLGAAGSWRLWVRARWADSCGNSLDLAVDDGPAVTIGQDGVYGLWHWVDAGVFELPAGRRVVELREREDGVAVDQILVCPADAGYLPAGPVLEGGREGAGLRHFADAFDRSPGHGNAGWRFDSEAWSIAFSLDPNRVPLQYALSVTPAASGWSRAWVDGPPWRGARLAASVRLESPSAQVALGFGEGAAAVGIVLGAGGGSEALPEGHFLRPVGVALEPGQWYRVEVERWAWTLRVCLDGLEMARDDAVPTAEGGLPTLMAAGGAAVVDDVAVVEIPWVAEDGGDFQAAWAPEGGARWYRPWRSGGTWALAGVAGAVGLDTAPWPVREVVVTGVGKGARGAVVPGAVTEASDGLVRWHLGPEAAATALRLEAAAACRLRRVAVRLGPPEEPDDVIFGPYAFSAAEVPDLADYLDFTEEEYRQIAASPEAEKLRREPKFVRVVGNSTDYHLWTSEGGHWAVHDGVLRGRGSPGRVRFWQSFEGALAVRFRVRLAAPGSRAALVLGEHSGEGIRLGLEGGDGRAEGEGPAAALGAEGWHEVALQLDDERLSWQVDGGAGRTVPVQRGWGGGVVLEVAAGAVEFDDIEIRVPRQAVAPDGRRSYFHVFDRRETAWRSEGPWIDHGGIACAVASSWVSLEALEGEGLLRHKATFGPDVMVAMNSEENTEWIGWDRNPSHVHHAQDNLVLCLGLPEDARGGYRLEVNSQDRRRTVLYRAGVEVAAVEQDARFPIRYHGGHAPYSPRRNRLALVRVGATVRALVHGIEVLRYEDPEPLPTSVVAIGGYRTRVNITHVLVRELSPPGAVAAVAGMAAGGAVP